MALATIPGYPRIGKRRELKRALEGYWSGKRSAAELEEVGGRGTPRQLGDANGRRSRPGAGQ